MNKAVRDHLVLEDEVKREESDYLTSLAALMWAFNRDIKIILASIANYFGITAAGQLTPQQAALIGTVLVPLRDSEELGIRGHKTYDEVIATLIGLWAAKIVTQTESAVLRSRSVGISITAFTLTGDNAPEYMWALRNVKWSTRTYSESIWRDTRKLKHDLTQLFAPENLAKSSLDDIAAEVARKYFVQKSIALRLIRTEAAALASLTKQKNSLRSGENPF